MGRKLLREGVFLKFTATHKRHQDTPRNRMSSIRQQMVCQDLSQFTSAPKMDAHFKRALSNCSPIF